MAKIKVLMTNLAKRSKVSLNSYGDGKNHAVRYVGGRATRKRGG